MSLTDLWPTLPAIVRDTILGERTEQGRKGRLFEENGMRITEVEVLGSTILDQEIAGLLEKVQRERVSLHIADRQADEKLRSDKLRHEITRQQLEIERENRERRAALEAVVAGLEQDRALLSLQNDERLAAEQLRLAAERAQAEQDAQLTRDKKALDARLLALAEQARAEVEADRQRHTEAQAHEKAIVALRIEELAAQSSATVAEREAIQPALVEALTALGDKMLLEEAARNMNLVSLFKGEDVATLFQQLFGGTRLSRTIAAMLPAAPSDTDDDGV